MTTRAQFAGMVLKALGIAVSPGAVQALVAVMAQENSRAWANPTDTTLGATGAASYNAVGVRNYRSLAQGVDATAATLRFGAYAQVCTALASGDAQGAVAAWAASPWGTFGDETQARTVLADIRARWPAAGSVPIALPPDPTPAPAATHPGELTMVATDPITGGCWVARPDGSVYAFGGAPYLGGFNTQPAWGRGGAGQPPCVGIAYDPTTQGYYLIADGAPLAVPEVYALPRTGIYA